MKPEFVQFDTADHLTLPGLLYAQKPTKRCAIHLHGNGTNCVFYKTNNTVVEALENVGVASLLFNNRGAHLIHSHKTIRNGELVRTPSGMAHEVIKECVLDIDAAVAFLKRLGYEEFFLIGSSTGANKICVYDHYKPQNDISQYVLLAGGDDTGIYYQMLGEKRFSDLLEQADQMIHMGDGDRIMPELLEEGQLFSARGFYDIANPPGDYNCFPFFKRNGGVALSKDRPPFAYFSAIKKPSVVIYGELDEYCGEGGGRAAVDVLRKLQPTFHYAVIPGADHGFFEKELELASEIVSHLAL